MRNINIYRHGTDQQEQMQRERVKSKSYCDTISNIFNNGIKLILVFILISTLLTPCLLYPAGKDVPPTQTDQ